MTKLIKTQRGNYSQPSFFGKKKKEKLKLAKRLFEFEGYKLLAREYKDAKTPLHYICPEGHKSKISYDSFRRGSRCAQCVGVAKRTLEEIKYKFEQEGYIFLSKEYKDNKSDLHYICPKGHEGKMPYASFRRGRRCNSCGNEKIGRANSIGKIKEPLYEHYSPMIDYADETRRSPENIKVLQVKCKQCGKWIVPTKAQVGKRKDCLKGNLKGESHFYCSEECKKVCSIFWQQNYLKGTKKQKSHLRLNQDSFRDKAIMCNDSKGCEICGAIDKLIAHHIRPYKITYDSEHVDNSLLICKKCDKMIHKLPGCSSEDICKEYKLRCDLN